MYFFLNQIFGGKNKHFVNFFPQITSAKFVMTEFEFFFAVQSFHFYQLEKIVQAVTSNRKATPPVWSTFAWA
jgi:hypothetical protein